MCHLDDVMPDLHSEGIMTRLKIAELLASSPVDPESHLDLERVEHYRRAIDAVTPVVVFSTDEGLLLADGYHRVAAALREGHDTVEAEVRSGSRHDALNCAAAVAAAQRGLSEDEVKEHILSSTPTQEHGSPRCYRSTR